MSQTGSATTAAAPVDVHVADLGYPARTAGTPAGQPLDTAASQQLNGTAGQPLGMDGALPLSSGAGLPVDAATGQSLGVADTQPFVAGAGRPFGAAGGQSVDAAVEQGFGGPSVGEASSAQPASALASYTGSLPLAHTFAPAAGERVEAPPFGE
jgi:hypothetical protein